MCSSYHSPSRQWRVHLQVTIIIIHRQGIAGLLTRNQTQAITGTHLVVSHHFLVVTCQYRWFCWDTRATNNHEATHDAYQSTVKIRIWPGVHYQHELCTSNCIRRSLTNSNKHTCAHLHRQPQPRSKLGLCQRDQLPFYKTRWLCPVPWLQSPSISGAVVLPTRPVTLNRPSTNQFG